MSLAVVTCMCGSVTNMARNFLKSAGYKDWLTIPIVQGKEKSRRVLEQIPNFPEVEMLDHFLKDASKWVVIIGYNDKACRWSDIAHNAPKSKIEAEYIVENFQFD